MLYVKFYLTSLNILYSHSLNKYLLSNSYKPGNMLNTVESEEYSVEEKGYLLAEDYHLLLEDSCK